MSRISLVEQYNNKDVIAQIYDVKDSNEQLQESVNEALSYMQEAVGQIDDAIEAAEQATNRVNEVATRTTALEESLGVPNSGAAADGTAYQRIQQNANDVSAVTSQVSGIATVVGDSTSGLVKDVHDNTMTINQHTTAINGNTSAIAGLESTVGDSTDGLVKDVADMENQMADVIVDVSALKSTVGNNSAGLVKDVADNTQAISDNTEAIATHTTNIADVTAQSNADHAIIATLPTTYQLRTEKDSINGYAGLNSAGKIAITELDTGVNLNQVLLAGAQLNTGEFLYIGPGGTIRSRVIGEGVTYVGNYTSLAALEAYPDPQNGDFGTVYGSTSDDGFYMYDGTRWNMVLLFDTTDYELIANKVTGISSASTDTQYPSAKAVYDFERAGEVAELDITQNTASGGVTVAVTAKNANGSTLATDSVTINVDNSAVSGSYRPITSGAVYSIAQAKQNALTFDATPTNGSSNPVTSDGVYDALATKQASLSTVQMNAVNSGITSGKVSTYDGYATTIAGKQNTLTVGTNLDATPTNGSNNPVTSDGVYDALAGKQATLVSGTNIKTVNNTSLIGSGNVSVQAKCDWQTVTLAVGSWSNNTQTASASLVTASNIVIISPTSASFDAWGAAGIRCTSQGAGTLTFACTTVPTEQVQARIAVIPYP